MSEPRLPAILKREMDKHAFNSHSLAATAGLKPDAVRNILRGKSVSPRGKTIQAIASALGVTVAYLLGEEPEMSAEKRRADPVPGPAERAELLRLWDGLDPETRKMVIFMVRAAAREAAAPTEGPLDATGDEGE
jgi:transcriptional regulator with XRE-family HTH domain